MSLRSSSFQSRPSPYFRFFDDAYRLVGVNERLARAYSLTVRSTYPGSRLHYRVARTGIGCPFLEHSQACRGPCGFRFAFRNLRVPRFLYLGPAIQEVSR